MTVSVSSRMLLPAMEEHGSRLLITDRVRPNNVGEMSPYKELSSRSTGLELYAFFGSKERTLADIKVRF